ncbi:MAG: hypothetical protein JW864_18095 [Spirochaetes bacterium]|nr:hypothetical protein [Spirochaetota bacterium]
MFADVKGDYHQPLSMEIFYKYGKKCDIMFSFRLSEKDLQSKSDMKKIQPLQSGIRSLNNGRIILNRSILHQSFDKFDEILMEMAALIHPEIFGKPEYKYFLELF